jgi:hypothetical protein
MYDQTNLPRGITQRPSTVTVIRDAEIAHESHNARRASGAPPASPNPPHVIPAFIRVGVEFRAIERFEGEFPRRARGENVYIVVAGVSVACIRVYRELSMRV